LVCVGSIQLFTAGTVRLLLPHCAPLLTIFTQFMSTPFPETCSQVIHNPFPGVINLSDLLNSLGISTKLRLQPSRLAIDITIAKLAFGDMSRPPKRRKIEDFDADRTFFSRNGAGFPPILPHKQ